MDRGKVLSNLKAARELLAQPGKWTKHVYARDPSGNAVPPRRDNAVCFCALGALRKVTNAFAEDIIRSEITALEGCLPGPFAIDVFNDAQASVEPVLAVFDEAIAKLEAA